MVFVSLLSRRCLSRLAQFSPGPYIRRSHPTPAYLKATTCGWVLLSSPSSHSRSRPRSQPHPDLAHPHSFLAGECSLSPDFRFDLARELGADQVYWRRRRSQMLGHSSWSFVGRGVGLIPVYTRDISTSHSSHTRHFRLSRRGCGFTYEGCSRPRPPTRPASLLPALDMA